MFIYRQRKEEQMQKRYFKPGDRVQLRSAGPVMEVMKYTEERHMLFGMFVSNTRVLCVWYDKHEGRKEGVFHQNSLMRASIPSRFMVDKRNYFRSLEKV
jgi:uncharacterized protein YodC (DUF2158 family)